VPNGWIQGGNIEAGKEEIFADENFAVKVQ